MRSYCEPHITSFLHKHTGGDGCSTRGGTEAQGSETGPKVARASYSRAGAHWGQLDACPRLTATSPPSKVQPGSLWIQPHGGPGLALNMTVCLPPAEGEGLVGQMHTHLMSEAQRKMEPGCEQQRLEEGKTLTWPPRPSPHHPAAEPRVTKRCTTAPSLHLTYPHQAELQI